MISAAALAFEILLDATVLDRPVAPLRVHDHQPGAARYGASGALLTVAQSAVQQRFAALFCAAAAASVSARSAASRWPSVCRSIRWKFSGTHVSRRTCWPSTWSWPCRSCLPAPACAWPIRGGRGTACAHLQRRHPGCRGGEPRRHGPVVRAAAAGRIEADQRPRLHRRGGRVARMRHPRRWPALAADGSRPGCPSCCRQRGSHP